MNAEPLRESAAPQAEQPLRGTHVVGEARKLLRIGDILAQGDFSRPTWFRWVRSGKAPQPVSGIPGHPRWRVADIDRFLEGRRRFFGKAQR